MASMFYLPCCEILKSCSPEDKSANELEKLLLENYSDLKWAGGQGPIRAMLLSAAKREDCPIRQVPDVLPPRFFYQEDDKSGDNYGSAPESSIEEIIENAYRKKLDELKEELLERIKKISDFSFEELVNELVSQMGFGRAETTRKSKDGGIDGYIYGDRLGLTVICIQSKHYNGYNVQRQEIQQFRGALNGRNGVFVTSSDFSSAAREEAARGGHNARIVLINGEQLVSYMIEYNIGVQNAGKSYVLKRIDSDFFNDL